LLREADGMLRMKYYEAAGRSANLAGFHAAQALISERTGRTPTPSQNCNAFPA
jgi:uncharacterized protein (UPF0332 family)